MSVSDILRYLIDTLAEILMGIHQFLKIDLHCDQVTSSTTPLIRIYINVVVIISWYLCAGSLMMISLFIWNCYVKCGYLIWDPPLMSFMTSSWKKYFFCHSLGRSFHNWDQIEAVLDNLKFSKWPPFWARDERFTGHITKSRIYQKDSHQHFRYFKISIDTLTQILMEIHRFQKLTYFMAWWRRWWRHGWVKHSLQN